MKRNSVRILVSLLLVVSFAVSLVSCTTTPTTEPTVKDDATYTYRSAMSASPTTWNPLTWESNSDSVILGYISMGFYDTQLNEAKDGYDWACEMASALPEDVTANYVGQYNIQEGETGKVWKIALNQNATWSDGTKITADDYIYSMQQQLDPEQLNRRSDSYTAGSFAIFGAKKYLYSATTAYYTGVGTKYDTIADAAAAGEEIYFDAWNLWGMEGGLKYDAETGALTDEECPQYLNVADETTLWFDPAYTPSDDGINCTDSDGESYPIADVVMTASDIYNALLDYGYESYMEVGGDYELQLYVENSDIGYAWEGDGTTGGVGLLKTGDYEITIVLLSSITDFEIKYNLTSNWLVKKDLYEQDKDAYCTTLETTPSYGPYKLTAYVVDQYFTLAKNDAWYGYTDGNHVGQYQTTNIDYTIYEATTAKEKEYQAFMAGELDDYSLNESEMEDYGTSKYLYVEPSSYTYQFFVTTNYEALAQRDTETENHSVLSIASFRKAISFALSRAMYCSTFAPSARSGFGILNYMYIVDPETGETYRDSEQAKRVSLSYAGFTEQEDGSWKDYSGESYSNLEDAYDAITCYDVNYAKELFTEAYNYAKSEGIYKDDQDVVILWEGVGSEASETRQKTMAMFNEMLAAAIPENTFKSITLQFQSCATEDQYWGLLQNGETDVSLSAWGGSDMDPWTIMYQCYIDPSNSLNYKFDVTAKNTPVTITLNGETYTYCLYDWAAYMDNLQADTDYTEENLFTKFGQFGKLDAQTKLDILAACESAQLETVANIPLFYDYTDALKSAKYNNGSETYVNSMIGFGGIRAVTYNYNDTEWTDFVAQQGGNLETFYKG